MERILGVNEVRPRLTRLLAEIESGGEPVVIMAKSRPRGVLLGYAEYRSLKALAERAKREWLAEALARTRARGEAAGLTQEDVRREIEEVRRARRP